MFYSCLFFKGNLMIFHNSLYAFAYDAGVAWIRRMTK